ncbi:MAG: glutathione S-transferase family protein [Burkholderiaceae bacterium]
MRYQLYYWPTIQGRGEFIRLALEQAGADYDDIARGSESDGMGVPALLRLLDGTEPDQPPFAPPFLQAGNRIIGQTANILLFLGPRLGLVPEDETSRSWAHQLQLTIADLLTEIHDTHHPIAGSLYYKDQKPEAFRRAQDFTATRLPKFLGYFERILERNSDSGRDYVLGDALCYVDLSLFQIIAGLRYAFPRAMKALAPAHPRLLALHRCVASQPRIAAYLASSRRLRFNQQGIFRHYAELDR